MELWLVIDLPALFKGRLCCFPKDPLEEVETWSESVDKVLSCKGEAPFWLFMYSFNIGLTYASHPRFSAGQIAFREFLKSEYSEENILFWLACEEYKKIKTVPEMISSANRIYSEFVQTEAPKQVKDFCSLNLNWETRPAALLWAEKHWCNCLSVDLDADTWTSLTLNV